MIALLLLALSAFADDGKLLGPVWTSGWMQAEHGTWQGTGHPDPLPLQSVSDAAMVERAIGPGAHADRQHALVSIGRRHAEDAVPVLAAALSPHEPEVIREMAVSGLLEHGGAESLAVLRRSMQHDPSPYVRGLALWASCSWGPQAAEEAVMRGWEDADPHVRGMAVLAVRALEPRKDRVLALLVEASASDERRVWQEAVVMLSEVGWPEAGAHLRAMAAEGSEKSARALHGYRAWLRTHPELR